MAITEAEQLLRSMFGQGAGAHETAQGFGAQALASMDLAGKGLELFQQVYSDPMAGFGDAMKLIGALVGGAAGGPAGAAAGMQVGGMVGGALAPDKKGKGKESGPATRALFGDVTPVTTAGSQSPGVASPQIGMPLGMPPLTSPASYAIPTPTVLKEDPYEKALADMVRLRGLG